MLCLVAIGDESWAIPAKVCILVPRVMFVTSWFMSLNRPYISPYLFEFIRRLTVNGIEVSVYAPRPPKNAALDALRSVRLYRAIGPFGFARFVAELLSNGTVIVHVQRPNTYATLFIIAARLLHRPVVATIHRAEVLAYHPQPWGFLRRVVLRMLDRAICVSNSTRKLAIMWGCSPGRTGVVYNTVDDQRFKPRPLESARGTLSLPLNTMVLLYVGNLRPGKGCENLIQAVAGLDSPCLLLMVGDGSLRDEMALLAKRLNAGDRVQFLGHIPHGSNKLPLYYNASDVFVLPSLTEGHSIALLEALSSGVPVVASMVGGNVETIENGENGLLVAPRDSDNLRATLQDLLSSPETCEKLRIAARKSYLQKFSESQHIAQTLAIYRELISF